MKCRKTGIALKAMDETGKGLARIATLSAVDHDGDTYAKGAFGGGDQWAQILAAHNWGTVPLGKARIFESGDEALADLHFNLDTAAGKEWHAALKFDLDNLEGGSAPVQEWSYGFRVLEAGYEDRDGERVRVLKRLKVFEVSPVVQGAGIGTGTLVMKGAALKGEHFERLTGDLADVLSAIRADPTTLSAAGLKQISGLHEGLGAVIAAAEAEEASARRLMAGQAFRSARRHLRET